MKKNYFIALIAVLWSCTCYCATIYVKPAGNGNGSSWEQAYGSLATALQNAQPGDEIWVSQGTYTPGAIADASFLFKDGVKVYGGFAGTEATLEERADTTGTTTILSGFISDAIKSKTILKVNNATSTLNLLDGFTIQGANWVITTQLYGGAGIQILNSTIELRNVTVKDNNITMTVTNPSLNAYIGGAGIFAYMSTTSLYNVNVLYNSVSITSPSFSQAISGGAGLFVYYGSCNYEKGKIESNTLTAQNVFAKGGGASWMLTDAALIKDVWVAENKITGGDQNMTGGGIAFSSAENTEMINTIFHHNTATGLGKALSTGGSTVLCNNVTFGNNDISNPPNGILAQNSEVNFNNCLLLENIEANSMNTLNYNNTTGKYSVPIYGSENDYTVANIEFVNPEGGNYTLQSCSPLLNSGDSSLTDVETDFNGNPRIHGISVDPGAIETQHEWANSTVYVNAASANTFKDGSTWEAAFTNLEDALDCGCNSNGTLVRPAQIWVAAGTYQTTPVNPLQAMPGLESFALNNNQAVYGGFAAGATTLEERDLTFETNQTILSGLQAGGSQLWHVVASENNNSTAQLDGFIIENGKSPEVGNMSESTGGGVYLRNSYPTLKNLWIRNNEAEYGAGMFFYTAGASMQNIKISDNHAYAGGGMYFFDKNGSLPNTVISDLEVFQNTSASYGGAINSDNGNEINISDFHIYRNSALNIGGGLFIDDCVVKLSRGSIDHNNGQQSIGGIAIYGASNLITESTIISDNTGATVGGVFVYQCPVTFTNCTFVNNIAANGANLIHNQGGTITIKNSIIDGPENGLPAVATTPVTQNADPNLTIQNSLATDNFSALFTNLGNVQLNTDPMFVNKPDSNYKLIACGPAVNVGVNSYLTLGTEFDADGNDRIKNNLIDLGALEYQYPDITISQQPEDVTTTVDTEVVFLVITPVEGLTYQWQVSTNDGATWTNIEGANLRMYTITAAVAAMNGNLYRCLLSDCIDTVPSDTALLTITGIAGINEATANSIIMYPNPAKQHFTLQITDASTNGQLTVYDVQGRTIYQNSCNAAQIQEGNVINCSGWASGIYWINWNAGNKQQTLKIIKE